MVNGALTHHASAMIDVIKSIVFAGDTGGEANLSNNCGTKAQHYRVDGLDSNALIYAGGCVAMLAANVPRMRAARFA